MKHYVRVTAGPYKGTIYEFGTKTDARALINSLEKLRPHSTDYGNDRDGFPEVHLKAVKGRRAASPIRHHATKKPPKPTRLPADLAAVFADMVDDAEIGSRENLYLGRRDLGYTGDPKEFRFSTVFGDHWPGAKHDRLVEIIDEFRSSPHRKLGRKLTEREADRLVKEAKKLYDEDRAYRDQSRNEGYTA